MTTIIQEKKPRVGPSELLKTSIQLTETQLWVTNLARRLMDKDESLDPRACAQITKELSDHAGLLNRVAQLFT